MIVTNKHTSTEYQAILIMFVVCETDVGAVIEKLRKTFVLDKKYLERNYTIRVENFTKSI